MMGVLAVCFLIVGLVCGGLMCYWYLLALMDWVGTVFGVLIAVVFLPGSAVFPLLYWFIEGVLPMHYLLAWVVGAAALIIAGVMFQRRIG